MIRKINVLHIVEDLKIGGMERIIAAIVEGLNKEKYNVFVWCLARGGDIAEELKDQGINLEILGMGPHGSPLFFLKLARKMKRVKIDILHAHGYTAAKVGRLAAIFAGIPIVLSHIHTIIQRYKKRQILTERFLNFFTDKVICCSQAAAEAAEKYSGIRVDKEIVIYNGVKNLEFSRGLSSGQIKKEFNLLPGGYVVGCVASLVSHKGHRDLLKAAKIVIQSQPAKNQAVKFLLVGDGPLRKDLEEYALTLGLNSEIIFAGVRKDIAQILAIMDMLVLPSCRWEGLGVSLIEAMAAGKPVIATRIGGIPEVIETNATGILVPPEDAQGLADAIIYLLEDKERCKKMGLAAERRYEEKFTAKIMMQKIEGLYTSLINEKGIR